MGSAADKPKGRRWRRLAVRCVAFAAAVVLFSGVLPWAWAPMVVPAMSPYVAICSAIAARTISVATLVGLPVLLIVLLRRRWFCRYLCPVGLATEHVGRLGLGGRSWSRRLPPVGRWVALATFGGAILGYPLALWLDPLAMFGGAFSLWGDPANLAGQLAAVALLTVLEVSLLVPGAWCLRICPLGATQELLALPRSLHRRQESDAESAGPVLVRRSVLSAGLGLVALAAGVRLASARQSTGARRTVLRPPGSVDEAGLGGLCVRCGNCVRACPEGVIHPGLWDQGIAGFLTPVVRFEGGYCREDCRRCCEVCPSGAIGRFALEEKVNVSIGLASVDMSLCLLSPDNGERECSVCKNACPYEAIGMGWDEEEYCAFPQIDPAKCPGCGACQVACPTSPEKAIVVRPC